MRKSQGSSTKLVQPATGRKLRARHRKRKAVLVVTPVQPTNSHAERVAAHRRQLEIIYDSYRESTAQVFSEAVPLADRKVQLRKNMRQLAKVLGDWHCTALDLLAEGQNAALLQMLPDFKGGRWKN